MLVGSRCGFKLAPLYGSVWAAEHPSIVLVESSGRVPGNLDSQSYIIPP